MKKNIALKNKSKKQGFALIFVLLFVSLLLITASAIWLTGMAEIRLQRRSELTEGAYQMAKAGMDAGWIKYGDELSASPSTIPNVIYPAGVTSVPGKVYRTYINSSTGTNGEVGVTGNYPIPNAAQTTQGVYDYWVYAPEPGTKSVYSIGYYKGNKVALRGVITHTDTGSCSGAIGLSQATCVANGGTWVLDHANDTLTITQL